MASPPPPSEKDNFSVGGGGFFHKVLGRGVPPPPKKKICEEMGGLFSSFGILGSLFSRHLVGGGHWRRVSS